SRIASGKWKSTSTIFKAWRALGLGKQDAVSPVNDAKPQTFDHPLIQEHVVVVAGLRRLPFDPLPISLPVAGPVVIHDRLEVVAHRNTHGALAGVRPQRLRYLPAPRKI